ncbi:hypothetical protein [Paraburkholderia terrae]
MAIDAPKQTWLFRQCEIDFQLELARGASCIASCCTDASLQRLVQETVLCFLQTHGPERFTVFRSLLAARLVARGQPKAAAIVASHPLPASNCERTAARRPAGDSGQ